MPTTDLQARSRPRAAAAAAGDGRGGTFLTIWAAALTVLLGLLFTGLTVVTIALWATDPTYMETNPVVDLSFFALGGIVTAGLASHAGTRRPAGLQQAILALLVLAVTGRIGGRVEPFVGPLVLLLALAPLLLQRYVRRQALGFGTSPSTPLTGLAAVASVPAVVYAAAMLEHARAAGPSCFLGQCPQGDRFAESAALAIAVLLVALLASRRTPGWLLPAWSAGLAALLLGAASLGFPGEVGALNTLWAVAASAWGAAFIVTARHQVRRVDDARPWSRRSR